MRCSRCGAEIPGGSRFCVVCGAEAKRAGRAVSPTAVGIIAAVLLVAGLAAGAAWWFMGMGQDSGAGASTSERSSAKDSDSDDAQDDGDGSASGSSAGSSADADGGASDSGDDTSELASYIGTWKGTFVSQSQTSGAYHCYGAKKAPLELAILDVGTSGRVTADVTVLFHNHKRVMGGDAKSTDGDTVIEVQDLVGTVDAAGSFEFSAELPDSMGTLKLTVETVGKSGGARELSATVESDSGYGSRFKDTYRLTKD